MSTTCRVQNDHTYNRQPSVARAIRSVMVRHFGTKLSSLDATGVPIELHRTMECFRGSSVSVATRKCLPLAHIPVTYFEGLTLNCSVEKFQKHNLGHFGDRELTYASVC